jgi:hypothetical protein
MQFIGLTGITAAMISVPAAIFQVESPARQAEPAIPYRSRNRESFAGPLKNKERLRLLPSKGMIVDVFA